MGKRRAVFFDAGDTLIHLWAPKQERLPWLCRQAGIPLPDDPERIQAGLLAHERFFQDRQKHPDQKTPAWYLRLFREGLAAMELPGDLDAMAKHLLQTASSLPPSQIIDPEAIPLLQRLRADGLRLGVVSNWDGTLWQTLHSLGLAGYFDAILDSDVVGSRKPDLKIFQLACAVTGVQPEEAVHVGDSLGSDVMGALAAGVQPVLLDAVGLYQDEPLPASRIRRLSELRNLLT